ncbi:MAG TPA: efflux RND transporter periplasmic adaptor subunit [Thermoanaerobaculia bacterium]|nr:efflux RND transporter periplasmic adaptor subunit [Thermoanaerobaculia bacterium]
MEQSSASKRRPAGGAKAVYISPQRQQLIGVRTAAIGQRQLDTTIRTVGTIVYDETRVAEIHTRISGWIDRVYVDSVGKPVRRNEPLFTVYSPELVSTENEFLLALKSKTQLEGSSVPATRAAAESLLAAAHDRLRLWDIPEEHIKELEQTGRVVRALMLHSPFAGVVLERKAFPGQYVTPEMALFRIADLSRIWVLGSVFEYELPLVKVGQDAEIRFPYGEATSTLRGKITFIYPDIDPQTRRARVRAEFPNPQLRLKPETYVTVLIRTGGGHELAIPKEAVIDTGAKRYALLALPSGYFEPREIQVGEQSNEFYRLIGGLKEGDRIVTSSQFLVDSESNLKAAMQSMAAMPGMDVKPAGGDMKGMDMPAQPPPTPNPER